MRMNSKIKLLIITDAWHPQVNGVVRTYEHLSKELIKMGHAVKVIGPSDFPRKFPMPGYKEIKLVLFPYKQLKETIETYAPTHIHISTEGPLGWAARRYCLKHRRAFSTSYHTQFPDYVAKRMSKYAPFLFKPIHALARAVVRTFHAPSSAMMVATNSLEKTLKEWGFKNPMHRLTRGANLDLFKPGEKTKFKDLKGPVALYVGRVAIEKSIEDFLSMPWQGAKVVIGDGPSREELEKQYTDAVFLGNKMGEELAEYYRSADVFVFPSRTDTFGIVLIEALASGLPVAGYTVTGPIDIITQDFLGALSNDNLAEAAQKALTSGGPEQRSKHVKDYYTWENAARQYEDALLNKVK